MNRRRFLQIGIGSTVLLAGAGLIGRHLGGYPPAGGALRQLSAKEFAILCAAAARICEGVSGPNAGEVARFVDRYLERLPPQAVREFRDLLQFLEHATFPRARFSRLDAEAQAAVLAGWQTSPLMLKRRGFQGLKTLVFLGFYSDARTWPALAYSGPLLPK